MAKNDQNYPSIFKRIVVVIVVVIVIVVVVVFVTVFGVVSVSIVVAGFSVILAIELTDVSLDEGVGKGVCDCGDEGDAEGQESGGDIAGGG